MTLAEDRERLSTLGITPWAAGDRDWFIRITPQVIRGRRIVPEPNGSTDAY